MVARGRCCRAGSLAGSLHDRPAQRHCDQADGVHLSEYADRAEREHERFTIIRNGWPSFVVMSADDLESLEETLFWLSRSGIREELAEASAAEDAGDAGPGMNEAELRASLGASGTELSAGGTGEAEEWRVLVQPPAQR